MNSKSSYDKHAEHQDRTSLGKLRCKYWTTKQLVMKKLGREEDEFVIASDADVDTKLELLSTIKQSCHDLLRVRLSSSLSVSYSSIDLSRLWISTKTTFSFSLMKKPTWRVFSRTTPRWTKLVQERWWLVCRKCWLTPPSNGWPCDNRSIVCTTRSKRSDTERWLTRWWLSNGWRRLERNIEEVFSGWRMLRLNWIPRNNWRNSVACKVKWRRPSWSTIDWNPMSSKRSIFSLLVDGSSLDHRISSSSSFFFFF